MNKCLWSIPPMMQGIRACERQGTQRANEHQDCGETSAILAHTLYPHTNAHGSQHEHQNHTDKHNPCPYRRIRTPTRTAEAYQETEKPEVISQ